MQLRNNILSTLYSEDALFVPKEPQNWSKLGKGGFQKRMLVLANKTPNNSLEIAFLSKVLTAVQYDLKSDTKYAFLTNKDAFSLIPMARKEGVEHILLFGFEPSDFGIQLNLTKYLNEVVGDINIIIGDDLSEIESNRDLKLRLWNVLKELFKA